VLHENKRRKVSLKGNFDEHDNSSAGDQCCRKQRRNIIKSLRSLNGKKLAAYSLSI
jgi:hypothetical protein